MTKSIQGVFNKYDTHISDNNVWTDLDLECWRLFFVVCRDNGEMEGFRLIDKYWTCSKVSLIYIV